MSTLIEMNDRRFSVEEGAHGRFWRKLKKGVWEPETFEVFDAQIDPDALMIDVGAWIGATCLYGAQLAKRCIAFEPDPIAFAALEKNVACNADTDWVDRLSIVNGAVNKDGKSFKLGARNEGGDSQSSVLFGDRETTWTVNAQRLDEVVKAHADADQPIFLKIDIEGGEYDLIPEIAPVLADPRVRAFISFHPMLLRNALTAEKGDEGWKPGFVDAHMAALAALPWDKDTTFLDGQGRNRAALEHVLQKRYKFPRQLLIA
ncbi:MAG: FkbM family methyltransferase [Pseudomonadota bacterium]